MTRLKLWRGVIQNILQRPKVAGSGAQGLQGIPWNNLAN